MRNIVFFLITLAFGLALAELGIRAATWVSPKIAYELRPEWSNRAWVPDQEIGYRLSPYYPGIDERGYRNAQSAENVNVLAVGDSMTYGYAVTEENSWPSVLQELSGLNVYNAGIGAYGPCEYMRVLSELSDLSPETVVLTIYLGNDLSDSYTALHIENRCSDLQTDDADILEKLDEEGTSLREQAIALGLQSVPTPFRTGLPAEVMMDTKFRDHIALYSLLRTLKNKASNFSWDRFGTGNQSSYKSESQVPGAVAFDAVPELRTVFNNPQVEELSLNQTDFRILEGWHIMQRAIVRMKTIAKSIDARFVIAIIPSKPHAYSVLQEEGIDLPDALTNQIRLEQDLKEQVIDFLTSEQINFVDTTPDLQQLLAERQHPFFESRNEHPSAEGYKAIAEAIEKRLQQD